MLLQAAGFFLVFINFGAQIFFAGFAPLREAISRQDAKPAKKIDQLIKPALQLLSREFEIVVKTNERLVKLTVSSEKK